MGNEASVQRLTDTVPPKMALRIDALVLPPPEPEPILMWNQSEDELNSASVMPRATIQSDTCSVSVRLDGKELDAGQVSEFPSRPIPIEVKNWGAMLELQFFASSWGPKPWSALCAPISKMMRFGAPCYTSLWLGLDTLDMDPSSETKASYSDSTAADLSLKGALARAHVHDAPKVRITLFRPSKKENSDDPQVQPDFDGVFHSGASDGSPNSHQQREKIAQQVDGLIRCLDESNALINTFYKSAALSTFREHLDKTLREMRAAYKLAEENFFVDAERLTAELEQLRLQHGDTVNGHQAAIAYQKDLHAEELMAKHVEWEEQRQIIDARIEDHRNRLQRQAQEQLQAYAGPGLQDLLEESHGVFQAELAQTLSQLAETWRSRVNDVLAEQEQQLRSHREMSKAALDAQNAEIERLAAEHAELQGEFAKLQVDHADRTKRTQAQQEELNMQLLKTMAAAERELEEHHSKVEYADRSHTTEIDALRATLDAHRREHEQEVAQAHARQALEHISLAAKHQAEHDRHASEAFQNHERELQDMQAQKEEELRRHESIHQTHQQQIDGLKRDLQEKECVTRSRLAEAAKWQAEVQKLHSELNDLYARGQRQEEERRELVDEHQAQLDATRQGVVLAQLEGAQSAAEKQRVHAEELHRIVEAHTGTLDNYQTKRDALRAQMRSIDEEATKTCDNVSQEFKARLAEIAEAFQASHQAQSAVEQRSLEALAAKEAEAAQKLVDSDVARVSEVKALQETIESYAAASDKEHAQLKDRLSSIKAETAAAEAKLLEDARKKLEEHRCSLQVAHSSQAQEFSQELRRFRQQRETAQAEARSMFELQKKELEVEAKRLREEVKDLPALRAKNSCKVLELQRIRKSHAAESELRSNGAPALVSVGSALEKCHCELSAMRHKLANAEERLRSSAQELEDVKESQSAELAALAAEVEATVSAASADRISLQDALQSEPGAATKSRLQSLEDLEQRYAPELINLRRRSEFYRQEIQEQQLLLTRAIAELRSTAGDDLKAALDAKTRALEELKRTRDEIVIVQADLEEASVRRKLDTERIVKEAEEQAKHQLNQHDQSVADEIGIQGERHTKELLRLKQIHEEERRHLQTIAQNNETQLRQLQSHADKLDKEVSSKVDGIPKLKMEWAACIENRDKELWAHTEKHASALAEERSETAKYHDLLQKEAAEQHQDLAQQVKKVRSEGSLLEAEIKALRASMEQEALEIRRDADVDSQTITELRAKVRAAEEQLQTERQRGRQKQLDVQQEVSSLETEHERFAFSVAEKQRQLQIEVSDTQKLLDIAISRHDEARADLELQEKDHELKRQRELHMRQISFEHDRNQRALEHKANMEALALNHRTTVDEDAQSHERELRQHTSRLEQFKTRVAELQPAHQVAESLNRELLEARENIAQHAQTRQSEALRYSRERQQVREELVNTHIGELEQDRLRYEESLRDHDLELERAAGHLQRQVHAAHEEHPELMHGSTLESLHRQLELQMQVLEVGSSHPQASDLYLSVEQEFAATLSQNLQVVQQEVREKRRKAREEKQLEAKSVRKRQSVAREEKLSEAAAELFTMKEKFQAQLQENEAEHRLRLEAIRQRASKQTVQAAEVQTDLERQLAAAEDVARKLRADAERMRQAHRVEVNKANESERASIEEYNSQEKEAEREYMRRADEIRQEGEVRIQEMRDQRLRQVDEVRRAASHETDRRADALKVKIKRDVWMAQQSAADLQKRCERADKRITDKRLLRDQQQSLARGSLFSSKGVRPASSESSADPLDDSLNRMILQLFCRLLAERYAGVVKDEVSRCFEKLHPDFAGTIRSSPAELALEVSRLLKSKKQGSVKEAFVRLDPKKTGKVLDSELDICLHNAFALDAETRGHITFLIESTVKLLRSMQNGAVRTGESCMSEEEFVKLFDDTRLGLTD